MSKYTAQALLQGFGLEENDLNININAEHEGDKGEGDASDFGAGDSATDPVVEEVVVEEDTSGTPEAAELDVADAASEVDETNEQIEDVSEAAEGLEGIALTLARISVEGLYVNPAAHAILLDQYKFVTRKFPALQTPAKSIPSFEAFAISEEGVTVSLEKVVDNLKSAGKAIVQFLKDLWTKFLALLGNANAAITVMKKKATELSTAKAGKAPEKVSVPGLLGVGLSVTNIQKLTGIVNAMVSARHATVMNAIREGKPVDDAFKEANADLLRAANLGSIIIGNFKIEVGEDNVPKVVSGDQSTNSERPAFGENDVHSIAKAVVDLASALETYKGSESKRKVVNDTIVSELSKNEVGSEDAGKVAKWKAARRAATLWGKQIGYEQAIVRKAIAVGNAANNVLAASLGKVSKGEAAGKEK